MTDKKKIKKVTGTTTIYWHKDGIVNPCVKVYRNGELADTKGKWEQLVITKETFPKVKF